MSTRIAIAVFIKAPHPGHVKTRLAQAIGDEHAVQLYRCFVQDVLTTVQTLEQDCLIFYSPPEAQQVLQDWLGSTYQYYPQQGEDLGDRMANAFQQGFSLEYDGLLLLGSDAPDLPCSILAEAIQQLQQGNAVIGPSKDGGYYTLGFIPATFCEGVFQKMPWSTPEVYALTLERFVQLNCNVYSLPQWSDIDTVGDLQAFYQRNSTTQNSVAMTYLKESNILLQRIV